MDQTEILAKKLQKSEQECGVLRHKLKGRKNDRSDSNVVIAKLETELRKTRDDLILAYKNLEEGWQVIKSLRKAFKIIGLTGVELTEFEKAMKPMKPKELKTEKETNATDGKNETNN